MSQIKHFRGINNVSDPLRLGMGWLVQADNVNVTGAGALERRDGYTQDQLGNFVSMYGTNDCQRLFLVKALALSIYGGPTLATLTTLAPMHWAEVNNQVFYSNGTDCGIIQADNSVIPWRWEIPPTPTLSLATGALAPGIYSVCCTYLLDDGRETGPSDPVTITLVDGQAISISDIPHIVGATTRVYIAPANSSVFSLATTTTGTAWVWNFSNDALGVDLVNDGFDPLPIGVSNIQVFKGRAYAAQHFPAIGQSVVWFSQPLGFHLFALGTDFFMVPGEVVMLAPTSDALIVGTREKIYAYTSDGITQLADYGVVPGQHWAQDDGRILFWATRGVCAALPFTNLTEQNVSVAPGIRAGGTIVRQGGQKRFVVALQQGGSAFNSY